MFIEKNTLDFFLGLKAASELVLWAEEYKPYICQLEALAGRYQEELKEFSQPGGSKIIGMCRMIETVLKTKRLMHNKDMDGDSESG